MARALPVVLATSLVLSFGAPLAASTPPANPEVPTTNEFMDLERDLSECISSNPLPGCGREPTSSGDRGGWQQLLLFGIMIGGIAIIFLRITRAIRARDRSLSPSNDVPSTASEEMRS
ncbi:MAG: hypothetical protein ACO3SP_02675 [Ilumatobacteraceae bacterium]